MKIFKKSLNCIDTVKADFFTFKLQLSTLLSLIKEKKYSEIMQHFSNLLLHRKSLLYPNQPINLTFNTFLDGENGYKSIIFPKVKEPSVSIVIPVYNQWEFTYGCLKSILKNTHNISYEIIIADDNSSDETIDIFSYVENVRVIRNQKNIGFLKNCNHAAQYALGKYLVLLNNDINVQPHWLKYLLDTIEANTEVGLIGSKLVYPTGKLQEAGGIVWQNATGMNYGHSCNPSNPEFNYVKEVDYISGAAIMIRRDLWNRIGGFDERFSPAYYEDTDLAFEIRKIGFKVLYQPESVVVHFEGASHGTDVAKGVKSYQVKNRTKFQDKWADILQKHSQNHQSIFTARDRTQFKKTLLFIDQSIPTYDKDAGSRTTLQYLQFFIDQNINVKFLCNDFRVNHSSPYLKTLQQMGIEVLYGKEYTRNWKTWFKLNNKYIDYVVLSRPSNIAKEFAKYIKPFAHIKILYFGHDLHHLRFKREYELTRKKNINKTSQHFKILELAIMRQVNLACFFSQVECNKLKLIAPEIRTKTIPLNIFKNFLKIDYNSTQRSDILFVGSFNHLPNQNGLLWFIKKIFPFLKTKNIKCTLFIVGSNPPEEIMALERDDIIVTGYVSDQKLKNFYKKCKLVVAPLRFGAGVKGKIIEALYHGLPVVTTNIGAEGIEHASDFMKITDDPALFADHIANILLNDTLANELSQKGVQYCKQHFSSEHASRLFSEIFG